MALYSRFKIVVLCALSQAAAADPSFEVLSGSCTVESDKGEECVYSDRLSGQNFGTTGNHFRPEEYSHNQDCIIKQNEPFPLDVRSFDVEGYWHGPFHGGSFDPVGYWSCAYDYLEVDGQSYCGTNGPQGIWPDSALVWKPGWSVLQGLESSFTICPVSRQPPRP